MNRRAIALLGLALMTGVTARAGAQFRSNIVAGIAAPRFSSAYARPRAARSDGDRAVRMANGALIGAGIGAAIGLVASPILNAQSSDHSEDATTYIVLPAFGAFVGLIVGGIIGWTRSP